MKDLMTIKNEIGSRTMRVSQWLKLDPVSFDIARRDKQFKVSKDIFEILISKLKACNPEYFRKALGLKTRINFKGYTMPVQAIVPYSNQPVEFYIWWCKNQDNVQMTTCEKIKLFEKVYIEKPFLLRRDHKQLLTK